MPVCVCSQVVGVCWNSSCSSRAFGLGSNSLSQGQRSVSASIPAFGAGPVIHFGTQGLFHCFGSKDLGLRIGVSPISWLWDMILLIGVAFVRPLDSALLLPARILAYIFGGLQNKLLV